MKLLKNLSTVLLLSFLIASCSSKQGTTTSKIKILGGNAFAAGGSLFVKANNGLILYGTSIEGKSFAKKIDQDTTDLNFPNGTWNFYAVAWELGNGVTRTNDNGLTGKVSCAKTMGVKLTGTDATINLNLANVNCDNTFHQNVYLDSTERKFPGLNIHSCKTIAGVTNATQSEFCRFDSTNNVDNKGYATAVRLVIPEYSNFGNPPSPAFMSKCLAINTSDVSGLELSTDLGIASLLNLPKIGVNGLHGFYQIFYTKELCDESKGFTTIPINQSSKYYTHFDSTNSKDFVFLETDAAPVCEGSRLFSTEFFASGRGTNSLPYTICNKEQFLKIKELYTHGTFNTRVASFDLLRNLDFNFAVIEPIGEIGTDSVSFFGNFNGRNNRIENFRVRCSENAASLNNGIFRKVENSTFSNLTLNKGVVECDRNNLAHSSIGLLSGSATNSKFKNLKVFGHVSGYETLGGLVGQSSISVFEDVHFEGGVSGSSKIGGLIGNSTSTANVNFILNSSVNVDLNAKCTNADCYSYVGGMVGYASSGTIKASNVKIKKIEGSRVLGGMAGKTMNVNIEDSIVTGVIISNSSSFVQVGGLIGNSYSGGDLSRNLVIVAKKSNSISGDNSEGIILGAGAGNCSNSKPGRNFSFGISTYSSSCNTNSLVTNSFDLTDPTFYATNFDSSYPLWSWNPVDRGTSSVIGDIPRLAWEANVEASVPYLKRECSGLFNSQIGAGTASNPKTICSVEQFSAMSPNVNYILKKNLLFPTTAISSKASGKYLLDGNNYALINISLYTSDIVSHGLGGIFKKLETGSEIKNLKIIFGNVYSESLMVTTNTSIGMLAGINSGIIKNVFVNDSYVSLIKPDLIANASTHYLAVGGLVGDNTGSIINSEIATNVSITRPSNSSDAIYVGGVSGINSGSINVVKNNGSVSRSMGNIDLGTANLTNSLPACASNGSYVQNSADTYFYYCNLTTYERVYPISSNEFIAGVVGKNSGNMTDINHEGVVKINDLISNNSGLIAPYVALNDGIIADSLIEGHFEFIHSPVSRVVATNTGSLYRTIFRPNTTFGFDYANPIFAGGTVDENKCISTSSSYCLDSATSITFTDPTLSIGGDTYNWSVGTNMLNPTNKTWLFDDGKLSLMRTSGSFEKLGVGF